MCHLHMQIWSLKTEASIIHVPTLSSFAIWVTSLRPLSKGEFIDTKTFPVNLWREGSRFLSRCLTTGIVSEGVTKEETLEHLRQGVTFHLKDSLPILVPVGPVGQGP